MTKAARVHIHYRNTAFDFTTWFHFLTLGMTKLKIHRFPFSYFAKILTIVVQTLRSFHDADFFCAASTSHFLVLFFFSRSPSFFSYFERHNPDTSKPLAMRIPMIHDFVKISSAILGSMIVVYLIFIHENAHISQA